MNWHTCIAINGPANYSINFGFCLETRNTNERDFLGNVWIMFLTLDANRVPFNLQYVLAIRHKAFECRKFNEGYASHQHMLIEMMTNDGDEKKKKKLNNLTRKSILSEMWVNIARIALGKCTFMELFCRVLCRFGWIYIVFVGDSSKFQTTTGICHRKRRFNSAAV